jgi:hypothetical protein
MRALIDGATGAQHGSSGNTPAAIRPIPLTMSSAAPAPASFV